MAGRYNRKDSFYQKAQASGYRSRASYKLIELHQKYNLIKRGFNIVDLGAWPGGWLQVAAKKTGPDGLVVGIDLVEIEAFKEKNIKTIAGDAREDEVITKALSFTDGPFDLLLSDMSAKLTGIKDVDRIAALGCAELALWGAGALLKQGGAFVCKVFKSNETEEFYRSTRKYFSKLIRTELKSTRKTSNEFYLVGFGFKGLEQEL